MKNNDPALTLLSGYYENVSMGADNNTLYLGVAGSTTPTVYRFGNFNFNKGKIKVLGPVELYFSGGFNVSAGIFGNGPEVGVPAQPELLKILVTSGSVNVNSGGAMYAQLVAPSSTVTINGTFQGSLVANDLKINGNGVAFTLPPSVGN